MHPAGQGGLVGFPCASIGLGLSRIARFPPMASGTIVHGPGEGAGHKPRWAPEVISCGNVKVRWQPWRCGPLVWLQRRQPRPKQPPTPLPWSVPSVRPQGRCASSSRPAKPVERPARPKPRLRLPRPTRAASRRVWRLQPHRQTPPCRPTRHRWYRPRPPLLPWLPQFLHQPQHRPRSSLPRSRPARRPLRTRPFPASCRPWGRRGAVQPFRQWPCRSRRPCRCRRGPSVRQRLKSAPA